MRPLRLLSALAALLAVTAGCAGAAPRADLRAPPSSVAAPAPRPAPPAGGPFAAALQAMAEHDAAQDWRPATCARVAAMFLDADAGAGRSPIASYNAGLVYQRCENDAEAKRRFEAAIAIDPAFLPALDQLALVYLAAARRPGARGHKDTAPLDLARTACERAIAIDPSYAPIHDTLGLVEVEAGSFARAAAAFARASEIDRSLLGPRLHAGALSLDLRAFADAERAYRAALQLRPDDYDARLGLAVALRGRINEGDDAGWEARFQAALKEVRAARKIAAERPEAYFNEALLELDYGIKRVEPSGAPAPIIAGRDLLLTFLAKAGSAPRFSVAVASAKERLEGIRQAIECDFHTPQAERREREQERHRQIAEEDLNYADP